MTPLLKADAEQLPAIVDALRAEVARLSAQLEARRDPDRLVTVKAAACIAGLTESALYTRCWRGQLQRHRLPGSTRFLVRLGDVLGGGQ